jgi:hypothetical protein
MTQVKQLLIAAFLVPLSCRAAAPNQPSATLPLLLADYTGHCTLVTKRAYGECEHPECNGMRRFQYQPENNASIERYVSEGSRVLRSLPLRF